MVIGASEVAQLRKLTDCGMMDCKKALMEANGDMEGAVEILRKKGKAKAANKASRIANQGLIAIKTSDDHRQAVMLEINCETDFVARDDNFLEYVRRVSEKALVHQANDIDQLLNLKLNDSKSVEDACQDLIVKMGEKINVRRVFFMMTKGVIGSYIHHGRIGVLVDFSAGDLELAKDIAMHIAALKPSVVSPEQVAEEVIAKEKNIYRSQAEETGKPDSIIEKIVDGRVKKFLSEISLTGQPFVKNPDIIVERLLKDHQAMVNQFVRYELGEGIERKGGNFVEEVMAQVR